MNCMVQSYKGDDQDFVVFVYSRQDEGIAYPLIERLAGEGLRIWYESESTHNAVLYQNDWNYHISRCKAVIMLYSQWTPFDHLARIHINTAALINKPYVALEYNQPVVSYAVRKQIEKATAQFKVDQLPAHDLPALLMRIKELSTCKGEPAAVTPQPYCVEAYSMPVDAERPSAPIQGDPGELTIDIFEKLKHPNQKEKPPVNIPIEDEASPKESDEPDTPPVHNDPSHENEQPEVETDPLLKDGPEKQEPAGFDDEKTIDLRNAAPGKILPVTEPNTVVPSRYISPAIVSLSSGIGYRCNFDKTTVGQARSYKTEADLQFNDECSAFSRAHFSITNVENICSCTCEHSNGLTINGLEDLDDQVNKQFRVKRLTVVQVPSQQTLHNLHVDERKTARFIVAPAAEADQLLKAESVAYLQSVETGECYAFLGKFMLGRDSQWQPRHGFTREVSRSHADICYENKQWMLTDHSLNSTKVNGQQYNHKTVKLNDGDEIQLPGDENVCSDSWCFIFHCVKIDRRTRT